MPFSVDSDRLDNLPEISSEDHRKTADPGELIVGKYVTTPKFIRGSISFCASTLGMIILVWDRNIALYFLL